MNLNGVLDTNKGEVWFWKVCGMVAILMIVVTSMWAFRKQIWERMFGRFARQRE